MKIKPAYFGCRERSRAVFVLGEWLFRRESQCWIFMCVAQIVSVCEFVSHLANPLERTMTNWSLCLTRTLECHLGHVKSKSFVSIFFSLRTMKEIYLEKKKMLPQFLNIAKAQGYYQSLFFPQLLEPSSHTAVADSCTRKNWSPRGNDTSQQKKLSLKSLIVLINDPKETLKPKGR